MREGAADPLGAGFAVDPAVTEALLSFIDCSYVPGEPSDSQTSSIPTTNATSKPHGYSQWIFKYEETHSDIIEETHQFR
jgi:hypothetical protein